MKVIIILEHRFERTPDGRVWTQTTFDRSFWLQYLQVFDRVCVVARVRDVPSVAADWARVDGDLVSVAAVPDYLGAWEYLRKASQVEQAIQNAVGQNDAVIVRAPSPLSQSLLRLLQHDNHPFAIEVVADPDDVFAPSSIEHPLRMFWRWLCSRRLRRTCAKAIAALYVTKFALEQRYPCPNLSMGISDVGIVTNPERMAQMSARNLNTAQEYRDRLLQARRNDFCRYVREQTEGWLLEQQGNRICFLTVDSSQDRCFGDNPSGDS
jgi:L-malate glycosyltransferase